MVIAAACHLRTVFRWLARLTLVMRLPASPFSPKASRWPRAAAQTVRPAQKGKATKAASLICGVEPLHSGRV